MGRSMSSSSLSTNKNDNFDNVNLASRYYHRLQIKTDPLLSLSEPSSSPAEESTSKKKILTLSFLQEIVEQHLKYIPFENISQHGAKDGIQQELDINEIISRVLHRNRGGFCFQLNGLLAHFLEHEFRNCIVCRVPSIVYTPENAFNGPAMHLLLICQLLAKSDDDDEKEKYNNSNENDNNTNGEYYLVDVAFGEPAIHPLKYVFDVEQITPEGMRSIITKDDDVVTLSWYKDSQWIPRLQWSYRQSMLGKNGPKLSDFMERYHLVVQDPNSIFHQKLIVCKLTKQRKYTLAGKTLKITGAPRFSLNNNTNNYFGNNNTDDDDYDSATTTTSSHDKDNNVTIQVIDSDDEIRQKVLYEIFGIPLCETMTMDFTKSIQADPTLWSQM